MRTQFLTAGLVTLAAAPALAGGVERSTQSLAILFEEGRHLQFGARVGAPDLTGQLAPRFGGAATGDIANTFATGSVAYKADITDKLSYALILDQPVGADVVYPAGSPLATLSGKIDSTALTGVMRYKFGGGVSAYAGVRSVWTSGRVTIPGTVVAGLGGPNAPYVLSTDTDQAFGYLLGVAYERPDIALRVALTYSSQVRHSFTATETLGGAAVPPTQFGTDIPQSLTLDFQSGVAEDTLVFGSVRWVDWTDFAIPAPRLGATIVSYPEDSITYTLGVGRQFTERWSGSLSLTHDTGTGNPTSNLGPTGERTALGVGVSYSMDAVTLSAGLEYDNSALGGGLQVSYSF